MAKSEDMKLMLLHNGREVASFRSCENVRVTPGFSTDLVPYVGADADEIDENNGPATVTFRVNPKSTDYTQLMEYRRRRALPIDHPERLNNVVFDAKIRVNHGDGGTDNMSFPDLKIGEMGLDAQGRVTRIAGDFTALCAKPQFAKL